MYRVTRKAIHRREDDEVVTYEAGDTFEPTEKELQAFGDRLEEVEEEVDENDTEPEEDVFEAAGIDPDDYGELQAAASEFDDIPGNLAKPDLKEALAEKLE